MHAYPWGCLEFSLQFPHTFVRAIYAECTFYFRGWSRVSDVVTFVDGTTYHTPLSIGHYKDISTKRVLDKW